MYLLFFNNISNITKKIQTKIYQINLFYKFISTLQVSIGFTKKAI